MNDKTPSVEVQDIFLQYGDSYRLHHRLSREQVKVMFDIQNCRSAVLGVMLISVILAVLPKFLTIPVVIVIVLNAKRLKRNSGFRLEKKIY